MACYLPDEMVSQYTLDGTVPIQYNVREDWTQQVQGQMNSNFTRRVFNKYLAMAKIKCQNYYGQTDFWLYRALDKHPIKDKQVIVFGSANPWYEAIMVKYQVKKCTVIEYSDRPSFHQQVQYIKPGEQVRQKFDFGLSISSFQHDGLGRYGDPLDPAGDLKAMKFAKSIIKQGGLMFLSVPIGKDKVCFNVHRIYGQVRMPLMLQGWRVVQAFGIRQDSFDSNANTMYSTPYQPVWVLQNVRSR